jgi:diadenosine tetraphosphate (Ap4A) HIT family hydrolase
MAPCKTCALLADRNSGLRPPWDLIYRTSFWDVVHAYDSSLPGWIVLVLRRHAESVAELTRDESAELGLLITATSQALKKVTGCLKTYVMQFAEAAEHPHVHVHIVPRMADLPPELRGPRIFAYLGVPEDQRVPEEEMNQIALAMRGALQSRLPL